MTDFLRASATILQVSDSESALVFKNRIAEARFTSKDRWKEATQLLQDSLGNAKTSEPIEEIDLFVFNGDCVKGKKQESETPVLKAAKFRDFADYFLIPIAVYLHDTFKTKAIVIVPGNHDVLRNSGASTASIETANGRLECFFDMVAYVREVLNGRVGVYTAPKSSAEPIVSFKIGNGAFEIFPLNSALLSGANIEMIAELLSGRGEKPLTPDEYERILSASQAINDAIDNAAKGIEESLKHKLSSDAALIPQQHLDQIASATHEQNDGSAAPCRIAVVHHNSVPYPHETSGRVKSYGFCNSGAFHEKLFDGGFRYVLHGHQHEGRVFELADFGGRIDQAATSPRRILLVGASCFGSDEVPEEKMGFNLIRLSRRIPDACSAEITHVTFRTTRNDGVNQASHNDDRVKHVSTVPPVEKGKHSIAENLYQNCLQTTHLGKYELFLNLDDSIAESFYGEFRKMREVFQSIHAIYSVSVFEPKLWGERRFAEFFLPEARQTLARAAAISKSMEAEVVLTAAEQSDSSSIYTPYFRKRIYGAVPGLHFRFSDPIFAGISQSNVNAKHLQVASRFSNRDGNFDESFIEKILNDRPNAVKKRETEFFLRALKGPGHALLEEPVNKYDSLSIWDNATWIGNLKLDDPDIPNIPTHEINNVAEQLRNRPFYEGISLSLSQIERFTPSRPKPGEKEKEYLQLQEFPRIVLWTKEHFQQPQALECIEFHEYCGFPLFWLNPERLKGRNQQFRKRYGHFFIIGKTGLQPVSSRAHYNDEHGNILRDLIETDDSMSDMDVVWGRGGVPSGLSDNADHIDEFMYLVRRPDLMFAADAWAISRLGSIEWEKMEGFLSSLNT